MGGVRFRIEVTPAVILPCFCFRFIGEHSTVFYGVCRTPELARTVSDDVVSKITLFLLTGKKKNWEKYRNSRAPLPEPKTSLIKV